jgi:hypothetical protein
MTQKEEETLEDYIERFQYNLQRTKKNTFDPETLRIIFLRGIKDDCMDALNLMGAGDISQMTSNDICELCKRYSRGITKSGKNPRDLVSRITNPSGGGVTRTEIGNMLDNFKTNILSSFSSQLDTFQAKKKKEEVDLTLVVFCPRCRKKHPLRECPLDNIEICGICEQNHDTKNCPSLPELKVVYQGATGETKKICFMAQKRPWPPKAPGMTQEQSQFPPYYTQYQYPQQNWYASMPWQQGKPQMQNQPWQQGWRGPSLQQPTPQTNPPIQHQPQLQLPSNQPPPRPTQLLAQPIPNPNNKVA